jgi:hypothetical protein
MVKEIPQIRAKEFEGRGASMKCKEAFALLGYRLQLPRLDWSAGKKGGICVSLYRCNRLAASGP